jgi:hypothetical protein
MKTSIFSACFIRLLQRLFVFRFEGDTPLKQRYALDQFGHALQSQEPKSQWQSELYRPDEKSAGVLRSLPLME